MDSVGYYVIIEDNARLASLEGLENLRQVFDLYVSGNEALSNFDGLTRLHEISDFAEIRLNPRLTNIDGLLGLGAGGTLGGVRIDGNPSLTNVDGLRSLTNVRYLEFNDSASLADLEGLRELTETEQLYIRLDPQLTSLQSLAALERVTASLAIQSNAKLPACEAQWLRDRVAAASPGAEFRLGDNTGIGTCP